MWISRTWEGRISEIQLFDAHFHGGARGAQSCAETGWKVRTRAQRGYHGTLRVQVATDGKSRFTSRQMRRSDHRDQRSLRRRASSGHTGSKIASSPSLLWPHGIKDRFVAEPPLAIRDQRSLRRRASSGHTGSKIASRQMRAREAEMRTPPFGRRSHWRICVEPIGPSAYLGSVWP